MSGFPSLRSTGVYLPHQGDSRMPVGRDEINIGLPIRPGRKRLTSGWSRQSSISNHAQECETQATPGRVPGDDDLGWINWSMFRTWRRSDEVQIR